MKNVIKKLLLSVSLAGFTLFSIPLISITLFQINFQPTFIINVNETPGLDSEKSRNPFSAKDSQGRDVTFSIYTLTGDYSWAFGYDGTNVTGLPAKLNEVHDSLPLSAKQIEGMNIAEEIICIGASSQEFEAGVTDVKKGLKIEENRAGRRANSIATWVRSQVEVPKPFSDSIVVNWLRNVLEYFGIDRPQPPQRRIRKLNIGQWEKPDKDRTAQETENQRRVIIVLVLRNEKGEYVPADDTALRRAFQDKANDQDPLYEYILNEYSKTRNGSFGWEI